MDRRRPLRGAADERIIDRSVDGDRHPHEGHSRKDRGGRRDNERRKAEQEPPLLLVRPQHLRPQSVESQDVAADPRGPNRITLAQRRPSSEHTASSRGRGMAVPQYQILSNRPTSPPRVEQTTPPPREVARPLAAEPAVPAVPALLRKPGRPLPQTTPTAIPSSSSSSSPSLTTTATTSQQHPPAAAIASVASAAASAPLTLQSMDVRKLLSERLDQFLIEQCATGLLDQADFTVIGVMGLQGVGKSTVLSLLSPSSILSESTDTSTGKSKGTFPIQSNKTILAAGHETVGIDMMATSDRLLLLDSQPLFSSSILQQFIVGEVSLPASTEYLSLENIQELHSIQLAVLLHCICNVVVVVQDYIVDQTFLRFLKTVDMLKYRLPDLSNPAGETTDESFQQSEFFPEVIFVFNKVPSAAFGDGTVQRLHETIDKYLSGSRYCKDGGYSFLQQPHCFSKASRTCVFFLPLQPSSSSSEGVSPSPFHDTYEVMSKKLRTAILSSRKTRFAKAISEKDWLRNAARMWEVIKRSPFLNEYNKTLQKMGYYR